MSHDQHLQASGGDVPSDPHAVDRAYVQVAALQAEINRLTKDFAATVFARELGEAVLLTATAGTIASPVTHAQLLRMIVETAVQVMSARSAALFLLDDDAQELIFEVALGPKSEDVQHHRVPVGHGIAGLVALSGQPMAVSDASNDPRQASDIARAVGYRPQSILCVPLFYGDDVIGVLELLDKIDETSFSATDIGTLGLFANQAAVAIAQSRAHGSLDALLKELLETRAKSTSDQPESHDHMLRRLVERAGSDEALAIREAIDLAELVHEIVWRGDREREACRTMLRGFADYLRKTSTITGDPGALL